MLPLLTCLLLGLFLCLWASNFKISTAARNAACDALVDRIDGGTGAGTIPIRTGPPPTNVADASSGTLLGTCTFSATAFGASSSGTATANSITRTGRPIVGGSDINEDDFAWAARVYPKPDAPPPPPPPPPARVKTYSLQVDLDSGDAKLVG